MKPNLVRSRLKRVGRTTLSWCGKHRTTRSLSCWIVQRLSYRGSSRCRIVFDRDLATYVHHFRDIAYLRDRPGIAPPSVFQHRIDCHALRADQLAKGAVVVELGAGTGTETVLLARMVGDSGQVLAVEAHPRTAQLLGRCVELNGLANVDVRCLAISDAPGTLTISSESADVSNSIRCSEGGMSVTATTLDALTADYDSIDLLKINIEGAERDALLAGASTLAKVRQVAVSCHDFKADRTGDDWFRTRGWVEDALRQAGFALAPPVSSTPPWLRDTVHGYRPPAVSMSSAPS